MLHKKKIAVVIPAYNEESQILDTIRTIPKFVDRIIVVNDASKDRTEAVVQKFISKKNSSSLKITGLADSSASGIHNRADQVVSSINMKEIDKFPKARILTKDPDKSKIILISLLKNSGVGAAIARGYKWCKDHKIDCTAVMAGDGQMAPDELEDICTPVINDGVDYVKGNRLIHRSAWLVIPKIRYFGNSILSIMTKVASGYWHVSDTQTGYTAISLKALNSIRLYKIYKRYGMPNDMLVKLNIAFCSLKEIEIKPVYNVGEKSKMKIFTVIPRISFLLLRSFFKRLWVKYFFRDFHPLFLFYNMSFLLAGLNVPVILRIINDLQTGRSITFQIFITFMFLSITAFQSLFFAMWMDISDNERLQK